DRRGLARTGPGRLDRLQRPPLRALLRAGLRACHRRGDGRARARARVPVRPRRLALHRRGPRPLPRGGRRRQRPGGALVGHRCHRQAAVDLARAVGRRTAARHRGGPRCPCPRRLLRAVPRRDRCPCARLLHSPTRARERADPTDHQGHRRLTWL
ncbi:MAG: Carnitine utilization associated thioesterase, partial [uncultured Nocardioidaceae bacterium]